MSFFVASYTTHEMKTHSITKKKLFVQFQLDYNLFFMQFNMWIFLFMNVFNVNNEKCYDLHT